VRRQRNSHRLPLRALPSWIIDQFSDRGALIIVCIAALAVAVLAVGVPWELSQGPRQVARVEGRIVGMGFVDIEGRGAVPDASIEVDGLTIRIEVPARLNCRVGDPIALDRISSRKGAYFILAPIPDPCGRLESR
jgi:hypothetical protein